MYPLFEKFKKTWNKLLEEENNFKSDDERYYCHRYIARIETDLQDISLPIGISYNYFSAALIPMVGQINSTTISLIIMHFVVGTLSIIPLVKSSIQKTARTYLTPALLLFAPLSYLSATAQFIATNNAEGTTLMTSISLVVSYFAIAVSPAKSIFYIPFAVLISVFAFFSVMNHPFGFTLSIIFGLANLATVTLRRMQHLRQLKLAMHEYALLIQAAPAKIIRHSAESETAIAELFSPQELQCVCLSSDWRGYQSLSAKKSALDLSTTLGLYYKACGELLAKWFPEGNYYSDWIADELFVVAYAKDHEHNRELVNQMILMSQDLLKVKEVFYQQHGFPKAIDIGISSGPALIGMMGPEWHKKATALGEVPGQSRRYQSAGKLLRMEVGQSDRIIFGPETLLLINRPFEISEFQVSDIKKVRDVVSPSIYHISSESLLRDSAPARPRQLMESA